MSGHVWYVGTRVNMWVVRECVWSGEQEWGDRKSSEASECESEWSRDDEWGGKAKRGEWGGMSGETRSLRRITAMVIIL